MGDILLYMDDLRSLCAATALCRICHEGEFESSKSLESPCACSGTVKVCFGIHPYSVLIAFFFFLFLFPTEFGDDYFLIRFPFTSFNPVCSQRLRTEMV